MAQLGFRRYQCQLCCVVCYICSSCDHGNRYCGADCAEAGRAVSMALAQQRYLQTFEGALNNSDRQERFRARQAEKVTHHGVAVTAPDANLVSAAEVTRETRAVASGIICVCCGAASPRDLVRLDFVRQRGRSAPPLPGSLRRPP